MSGFVKIYGTKLITSSLWDEAPEARLVFLSLLAIADATGFVDVPNERALARVINLDPDYVERALAVLMAPDAGSRSDAEGGRRVVRDGSGWRCVNYEKYREFRSASQEADRIRQERHRAGVTSHGGHNGVTSVTLEAEAEAKAKAETRKSKICAETAQTPSSAPLLVFPCDGGKRNGSRTWGLAPEQVAEWSQLFPSLDILAQCRAALAWVKAKPARRKTADGMPAFLVGWFGRNQNRGGPRGSAPETFAERDMRRREEETKRLADEHARGLAAGRALDAEIAAAVAKSNAEQEARQHRGRDRDGE